MPVTIFKCAERPIGQRLYCFSLCFYFFIKKTTNVNVQLSEANPAMTVAFTAQDAGF